MVDSPQSGHRNLTAFSPGIIILLHQLHIGICATPASSITVLKRGVSLEKVADIKAWRENYRSPTELETSGRKQGDSR